MTTRTASGLFNSVTELNNICNQQIRRKAPEGGGAGGDVEMITKQMGNLDTPSKEEDMEEEEDEMVVLPGPPGSVSPKEPPPKKPRMGGAGSSGAGTPAQRALFPPMR
jgi:hypothetical protein